MQEEEIRRAQKRVMSVFGRRPEAALSHSQVEATVSDGLVCHVTDGEQTAVLDMPTPVGGTEAGPTPGFHARVAVSGCIAIGIKMTAVRLGVELQAVNVIVEMDFDDSALFGMGNASAAPLKSRVKIRLESNAEPDRLNDLVEIALAADPFFLALRDAQDVATQIEVV